MKSIILLLAIIGIIIVCSGYIQNNLQCPPPIVQYRYIEKTFEQEQDTQKPLLSIAGINTMGLGAQWLKQTTFFIDRLYQSSFLCFLCLARERVAATGL